MAKGERIIIAYLIDEQSEICDQKVIEKSLLFIIKIFSVRNALIALKLTRSNYLLILIGELQMIRKHY